jgi:hypothetical protein
MTPWILPRCRWSWRRYLHGGYFCASGSHLDADFFVAIGLLMAEGLRLVDLQPDPQSTKIIAEVTLV